jgi:hypothetical protein
MSVSPLYGTVGSPVLVSAYMVQGTNIQYTWLNSGSSFSSGPRTCIFIFFLLYTVNDYSLDQINFEKFKMGHV